VVDPKFTMANIAVALWILFNEASRTEILLKPLWLSIFSEIRLVYPQVPINQAAWLLWLPIISSCLSYLASRLDSLSAKPLSGSRHFPLAGLWDGWWDGLWLGTMVFCRLQCFCHACHGICSKNFLLWLCARVYLQRRSGDGLLIFGGP
jgi:hypothetical protein